MGREREIVFLTWRFGRLSGTLNDGDFCANNDGAVIMGENVQCDSNKTPNNRNGRHYENSDDDGDMHDADSTDAHESC